MTNESLPSGVLKVAEECKRLLATRLQANAPALGDPWDSRTYVEVSELIDQLAALSSPPPQATGALTFAQWADSLSTEDRYDFDSEGRGFKKDCGRMMRLAWDAALSSAKREAEPLTDAKVIAMNPYLNDEGRRALWLAAFRMAEKHHGITAASQVEPEEKQ